MSQGRAASKFAPRATALFEVCVAGVLLVALDPVFAVPVANVALELAVLTAAAALDVKDITAAEPDATAELAAIEGGGARLLTKVTGKDIEEGTEIPGGTADIDIDAIGAGDAWTWEVVVTGAGPGGGAIVLCSEATGAGAWVD